MRIHGIGEAPVCLDLDNTSNLRLRMGAKTQASRRVINAPRFLRLPPTPSDSTELAECPSARQVLAAILSAHHRIKVFKESPVLFHGTNANADPFG